MPAVGMTLSVLPYNPLPHGDRWLLKMHGCVTRPNDIVLTRNDYIRFAAGKARPHLFALPNL